MKLSVVSLLYLLILELQQTSIHVPQVNYFPPAPIMPPPQVVFMVPPRTVSLLPPSVHNPKRYIYQWPPIISPHFGCYTQQQSPVFRFHPQDNSSLRSTQHQSRNVINSIFHILTYLNYNEGASSSSTMRSTDLASRKRKKYEIGRAHV